MKSGNAHHREALKRSAVVATRDQEAAEFEAVIDDYVAAAMAAPSPSVLDNLAQSYRAAGDYDNPIAQYRLFLDRGKPGTSFRKLFECQIGAMAAALARVAAAAPPRGLGPDDDPDSGPVRPRNSAKTTTTGLAEGAPGCSPSSGSPPTVIGPAGAAITADGTARGPEPVNVAAPSGAETEIRAELPAHAPTMQRAMVGAEPATVRLVLSALPTAAPRNAGTDAVPPVVDAGRRKRSCAATADTDGVIDPDSVVQP
ncbi:MAG: hypothetical protein R3B06_03860 [Kofleriaceae bacterium]